MAEPQDMLESDGAPGYLAAVTLVSEAYTTLQGILETCWAFLVTKLHLIIFCVVLVLKGGGQTVF